MHLVQGTEGSDDCMVSNETEVNWCRIDVMFGTKPLHRQNTLDGTYGILYIYIHMYIVDSTL